MIVIVHFGSQYTPLIRRSLTELGVASRLLEPEEVIERPAAASGVILSGSPDSVDAAGLATVRRALSWKLPILGICYGHQALARACGGTLATQHLREYGRAELRLTGHSLLLADVPTTSQVWMSHGDSVTELPPRAWRALGETAVSPYAIIANEAANLYGVQFHPEVSQSEQGKRLLDNFVRLCGSPRALLARDLATETTAVVAAQVPEGGHVLAACSLGVDSTTLATVCARTLGPDRVHTIFVDHGLNREEDLALLPRAQGFLPNLTVVNAADRFLGRLQGVEDPEEKRRIIGRTFWEVFQDAVTALAAQVPLAAYAQGTLAPDVIESGRESAKADTIKTHHNLVAPPPDFPFAPLEPFRTLYKDEVRALGRQLGVPEEILRRHPFPGPGLAVRIEGALTPDRLRIARACDTLFIDRLKADGFYDQVTQAGAVVTASRPRCVRGDARGRGWAVCLYAMVTRDFMTADVARFPPGYLEDIGDAITNRIDGVGCVVWKITRKPPATVEWE